MEKSLTEGGINAGWRMVFSDGIKIRQKSGEVVFGYEDGWSDSQHTQDSRRAHFSV